MKRLHVHLSVDDIAASVGFYSTLFGTAPSRQYKDYAKWSLEDPRVNFAISRRGRAGGLDHLGLQVDDSEELQDVAGRLAAAGATVVEQKDTACCYARSAKAWVTDPQGIAWETFRSHGEIAVYGDDDPALAASACCDDQPCGATAKQPGESKACCA